MRSRISKTRVITMVAVAIVMTLWVTISPARAHEPGFSSVRVVVLDEMVEVNLSVPLDLLGESAQLRLSDNPQTTVATYELMLTKYFEEHVTIRGSGAANWHAAVIEMSVTEVVDDDHLDAVINFTPPNGVIEDFDLLYDVIIDHDEEHQVIVGVVNPQQDTLAGGTLRSGQTVLSVSADGSTAEHPAVALLDVVTLGFDHVLEGADHILFLIVLILPAPLAVDGRGRWGGTTSPRRMVGHVIGVSTAFLVGHSATLALASLGWVNAPPGPVELLIAASIAVGAIHAIRPILRRGEVVIAGVFGLVHGLAFAEILDSLRLNSDSQLTTLLAFNIGVEVAQLTAVAAVLPAFYLLSRTAHYSRVRVGGAAVAFAAALGWMGDRAGLFSNPLAPIEAAAIDQPLIVVTMFSLAAAVLFLWTRAVKTQAVP